jgi:TRAP-type C4-dicarboxylate transport system substrate-binding protein
MVRINNKSLIPICVAVLGFILSPEFYNLLPDKYAHIIAILASIVAIQLPKLIEKKHEEAKDQTQ